jgi:predicted MFS family arabinose efflux permease
VIAVAAFYIVVEAAGVVVLPAIQEASADNDPGSLGARAAALVNNVQSLAPLLAAPLLAGSALVWGWQGDFEIIAAGALVLALVALRTQSRQRPTGVAQPGYVAAFRLIARAHGAVALLLGSSLRACFFWVHVSFLAAYLSDRFDLSMPPIALLFSLSGLVFLLVNQQASRWFSVANAPAWRAPERLLPAGLLVAGLAGPLAFVMPSAPLAALVSMVSVAGHGVAVASSVTLIVRRYAPLPGAMMRLKMAGNNLGAFVGGAAGGLGLGLMGYPGLALAMALLALGALLASLWTSQLRA